MANRTDPLVSQLSGSDPQNLMEYLTRQRIYDSRYWKEICFGLTVQNVLEESTRSGCIIDNAKQYNKQHKNYQQDNDDDDNIQRGVVSIGHLNFLSLTLKLLQLHPETTLIVETFVEQNDFLYTRALGALYVRLTGRPADIYQTLEVLYQDRRQVQQKTTTTTKQQQQQQYYYMDEYIHQLLTESTVAGIALPRLPQRYALEEAGYLPTVYPDDDDDDDDNNNKNNNNNCSWRHMISRPTALQDLLERYGGPLEYLKYKALVEHCPIALNVWNNKYAQKYYDNKNDNDDKTRKDNHPRQSTKEEEDDDDENDEAGVTITKQQPQPTSLMKNLEESPHNNNNNNDSCRNNNQDDDDDDGTKKKKKKGNNSNKNNKRAKLDRLF